MHERPLSENTRSIPFEGNVQRRKRRNVKGQARGIIKRKSTEEVKLKFREGGISGVVIGS
jgi:hypothetical protein